MVSRTAALLAAALAAGSAAAQSIHTYIGQITPTSVLIAWGSTEGRGRNTIGRNSQPLGAVQVRIADQTLPVSDRNWIEVTGLRPDTAYPYEVDLNGRRIGGNIVRTWPVHATH